MAGVIDKGNARADEVYKTPCGVEGCNYGPANRCGLNKLLGIEKASEAYLNDAPIAKECLENKLTDAVCGIIRDDEGKVIGMDLSENIFFEIKEISRE